MEKKLSLNLIKKIPLKLKNKIQHAVLNFIEDADIYGDPVGLYNQTIQSIANATNLGGKGDFWLAYDEETEEVAGYVLGNVQRDIDNRLCYWITQGYVSPKYRNGELLVDGWSKIMDKAKECFCSHIAIISTREPRAFIKALGGDWKDYARIMIQDIEEEK